MQLEAFEPAPAKRGLPPNFTLTPDLIAWCKERGLSDAEARASFDYFLDYCTGRGGRPYANYKAAFRNCARADWGGIVAKMRREGSATTAAWEEFRACIRSQRTPTTPAVARAAARMGGIHRLGELPSFTIENRRREFDALVRE